MCDDCELKDARIGELEQRVEELEDSLGDAECKLRSRGVSGHYGWPGGQIKMEMVPDPARFSRQLRVMVNVSEEALHEAAGGAGVILRHMADEMAHGIRRELETMVRNMYPQPRPGQYSVGIDPAVYGVAPIHHTATGIMAMQEAQKKFIPEIWTDKFMKKLYPKAILDAFVGKEEEDK